MAAWKLLGPGVTLGIISAIVLSVAMTSDYWYILDASLHERFCPERAIFEDAIPWPYYAYSGFYAAGSRDIRGQQFNEHSKDNKRVSQIHPAPLQIKESRGNASRSVRTITDLTTYYPPDLRKLREWKRLMEQLYTNLRSFGGRDITQKNKKRKEGNQFAGQGTTNTTDENSITTCKKRQFSTSSGLWRTCYLPEAGSLLEKLIDCGNLTRCAPVFYGNIDYLSIPASLRLNETSQFYRDELTLLHVRRTVASFLFLSIVTQVVGLVVVSWGWLREECFEQYAGGLVLLMSGIFQLAGLCTHIIQCRIEMSRTPSEVYAPPSLVLHGYGSSAYSGWASFGTTLLSSFLCIMAPLHPTNTQTECKEDDIKNKCLQYTVQPKNTSTSSSNQPLIQPTPDPAPGCGFHRNGGGSVKVTPIFKPVAKQRTKVFHNEPGSGVRVAIEPWDSPSHFSTYLGNRRTLSQETPTLPQLKRQRTIKRQMSDLSKVSTLNERESKDFYRRTRSLPRDASGHAYPDLRRDSASTISRCSRPNYYDRTWAPKTNDYDGSIARLEARLSRLPRDCGPSDMRKVAEIFRSANPRLPKASESLEKDEIPENTESLPAEKWDPTKSGYLPCERSKSKFSLSEVS